MATSDLISREAAVREALDMYHALAARRDACQGEKDAGGTVMWTAAAEIAQVMVRRLMELPEADDSKALSDLPGGVGSGGDGTGGAGGGGRGGAGRSVAGGEDRA